MRFGKLPATLTVTCGLLAAPMATAVPTRLDLAAIDAYVRTQAAAWNVPGTALVLVQDGSTVHLRTFGEAGPGRPVTVRTPFDIGSCSKSFTALAVMQLVEDGRLDVDEPVQRYLPWFRVENETASKFITVRHLLNHTSGISMRDTAGPTMVNPDGKTLEAQVRSLSGVPISTSPGTSYQYSNFNYMTLALVVERVSGQTFGEYLRQRIFTPLQMGDSFTDRGAAERHGLSDGHTWWFGFPFRSLEAARPDMLGAGYVFVSPEDMSHYLIAQLNDGLYRNSRVLSANGVAAMHTPASLPRDGTQYGMGWVSYQDNGQTIVNHNGQSASFTSSIILVPAQKTGIAIMTNVSGLVAPHAAWSLAMGVKRTIDAQKTDPGDTAFRNFYLMWDGGFLLATALLLMPLARRLLKRRPASASRSKRRIAIALAVECLLMFAALLGLPLAFGWTAWRGMFVWQPDAALWCLAAGVLLLVRLAVRLPAFVRRNQSSV